MGKYVFCDSINVHNTEDGITLSRGKYDVSRGLIGAPINFRYHADCDLKIKYAGNTVFPLGLFKNSDVEWKLNIESDGEVVFREGVFEGLNFLDVLGLESSKEIQLEPYFFKGLDNLRVLKLCSKKSALKPGIFVGMDNLNVLSLESDEVHLDSNYFKGLDNTERLYIAGNVTCLNNPFKTLPKLHSLFVTGDYSKQNPLPNNLFDGLNNLKRLDINSESSLEFSDDFFDELTGLDILCLDIKADYTLPKNIFRNLANLTFLDFDEREENNITELPDLNHLHNLTHLIIPERLMSESLESKIPNVFCR
jgi:hypothetical protein